ncbi:DDB1- and CUL4-associated factor 10 [Trichogramma pretiosum]|uniref:DDB1- and CUL4-associated factor 10 n=1 Tax=Trichogramma pretiosum TaxID=7493 RepID=UPI0006C9CC7F|nr:DDB1- and CUL4-associated factor 10 [Trichogramma pretiosum]
MPKLRAEQNRRRAAAQARQSFSNMYIRNRELGMSPSLGQNDMFHKTLYTSVERVKTWDNSSAGHGAVFNLEYSPDGSLLLAACEKKSVLMFDPLSRRLIHSINEAHDDCVNGARFLDQRMFATCSDDSTVALWDARNLKNKIRKLQGHSNWVKNIEYIPKDKLLLTSGFDGVIFSWDINNLTEDSCLSTKVFQTNGLMRSRLTPDATKMLICTTSGYLIVIHDLNLSTLNQDLHGFKPNLYRLMQLSQTTIPVAASFTHLFSNNRTQNRLEFVTDFPSGDDAEVISSLQVHPHGWCALSRNVSSQERSEWTCIHDIQERSTSNFSNGSRDLDNYKDDMDVMDEDVSSPASSSSRFTNDFSVEELDDSVSQQPSRSGITSSFVIDTAHGTHIVRAIDPNEVGFSSSDAGQPNLPSRMSNWQSHQRRNTRSSTANQRRSRTSDFGNVVEVGESGDPAFTVRGHLNERFDDDDDDPDSRPRRRRSGQRRNSQGADETSDNVGGRRRNSLTENRRISSGNVELHVNSADVWEALVAIREARLRRENEREFHHEDGRNNQWTNRANGISVHIPRTSHTVVIVGDRRPQNHNRHGPSMTYAIPRNHRIHQNTRRLTHYIEEPNVGSGYIKELCFSSDGRLICSPYGKGLRLLAFSNECQELSDCVPNHGESVPLHEVASSYSHDSIVTSTKFSPRHCLLVSGCLGGRIVWYQPLL